MCVFVFSVCICSTCVCWCLFVFVRSVSNHHSLHVLSHPECMLGKNQWSHSDRSWFPHCPAYRFHHPGSRSANPISGKASASSNQQPPPQPRPHSACHPVSVDFTFLSSCLWSSMLHDFWGGLEFQVSVLCVVCVHIVCSHWCPSKCSPTEHHLEGGSTPHSSCVHAVCSWISLRGLRTHDGITTPGRCLISCLVND